MDEPEELKEGESFEYIGMTLKRTKDGYEIGQKEYLESVKIDESLLHAGRLNTSILNPVLAEEVKEELVPLMQKCTGVTGAQMNVLNKRDPLLLFSLSWETTPKIRIHTGSSPFYRLFGKVKRAVANMERGYGIAMPEDKQLAQQLGGLREDFLKAGGREKRARLTTRLFIFHLEWITTDMFSRFRSEDAYEVPTDPRQPRVALTETGEEGKRKADHNSPSTIEQNKNTG
uniref:Uncharacterized protein n=1 Tax=Chromera velia CCMP2878 TaxID=1169474 RepID=A0A0G4F3L8_9ALVE|eukprot:Cvel_14830.t1-p1 / transcript=Cvel_14830.t1 / gene=Cvel_14830 / organism=Chromera_velia_CCMP2878 / gene_product=hypothetical protein / transcript_product=hypothetical protein / location=Cvel_scaffold1070:48669-56482(+) / protein_length=229 / sequence_SO=supercontig / SO=protein_coding / is_pseudo=false